MIASYPTLYSKQIAYQAKEVRNMNQTKAVQVLVVYVDLARHSLLERGA